ncbi:MAG: hypothetical protein H7222_11760 [Methylotenera sp.]|nr:hypothetical protein [Oligoflexia bacterium]
MNFQNPRFKLGSVVGWTGVTLLAMGGSGVSTSASEFSSCRPAESGVKTMIGELEKRHTQSEKFAAMLHATENPANHASQSVSMSVLPDQGTMTLDLIHQFKPATLEHFEQVVAALSSEKVTNGLANVLAIRGKPPAKLYTSVARAVNPDDPKGYLLLTEVSLKGTVHLGNTQMKCSETRTVTTWARTCEPNLKDEDTAKRTRGGGFTKTSCTLKDTGLSCETHVQAKPKPISVPFLLKVPVKRVTVSGDLTASQAI